MCVYLAGILAGSLWTSLLIPGVFLSGASSGVYALITAHLATVIMNFRCVEINRV
jgi:rhomboid-related protein 1/2/3